MIRYDARVIFYDLGVSSCLLVLDEHGGRSLMHTRVGSEIGRLQ